MIKCPGCKKETDDLTWGQRLWVDEALLICPECTKGYTVSELRAFNPRQPQSECPICETWQDDNDGLGVIRCYVCGYCVHPSYTKDDSGKEICEVCGEEQDD